MTVAEVKEFIDHAPAGVTDISFAIDKGEFAELQFDTHQFYFQDMIVLNLDSEKVTVFKRK